MFGSGNRRRRHPNLVVLAALISACATSPAVELAVPAESPSEVATTNRSEDLAIASPSGSSPTTTDEAPTTVPRTLAGGVDPASVETSPDGAVVVQETPIELRDRQLATVDTLPPPIGTSFEFNITPFSGEPLGRSTWHDECPVEPEDLRYVTVSFWGFDDRAHTGELVIDASEADAVVSVFRTLFDKQFPIEEMRIVTPTDLLEKPTGDSNNTASYVCRSVTGGSRFSEHAYGLAVDVNPFHNPYVRDDIVIPELASSYLDRTNPLVGMVRPDDIVVWAFAQIGWAWGGDWNSLKDYQHFTRNNR